jgi:hypothetical protein
MRPFRKSVYYEKIKCKPIGDTDVEELVPEESTTGNDWLCNLNIRFRSSNGDHTGQIWFENKASQEWTWNAPFTEENHNQSSWIQHEV